ncbi:hypothetical protein V8G54_015576 [Vigna mungo]|uniref:Uncharacterized protein n=1 Tax=Vigna mungo TaxID=3915 RepID=A0AAQ3NLH6_VIGMU
MVGGGQLLKQWMELLILIIFFYSSSEDVHWIVHASLILVRKVHVHWTIMVRESVMEISSLPKCLSELEKYLIAEPYDDQPYYGIFSISVLLPEFVYSSYGLGSFIFYPNFLNGWGLGPTSTKFDFCFPELVSVTVDGNLGGWKSGEPQGGTCFGHGCQMVGGRQLRKQWIVTMDGVPLTLLILIIFFYSSCSEDVYWIVLAEGNVHWTIMVRESVMEISPLPWCLSKLEQYLIAEPYDDRAYYGIFSISQLVFRFLNLFIDLMDLQLVGGGHVLVTVDGNLVNLREIRVLAMVFVYARAIIDCGIIMMMELGVEMVGGGQLRKQWIVTMDGVPLTLLILIIFFYSSCSEDVYWIVNAVGRYMCQPWCLSKLEQYLIAEPYDDRAYYGIFSISISDVQLVGGGQVSVTVWKSGFGICVVGPLAVGFDYLLFYSSCSQEDSGLVQEVHVLALVFVYARAIIDRGIIMKIELGVQMVGGGQLRKQWIVTMDGVPLTLLILIIFFYSCNEDVYWIVNGEGTRSLNNYGQRIYGNFSIDFLIPEFVLHENVLVVESYMFRPRCKINNAEHDHQAWLYSETKMNLVRDVQMVVGGKVWEAVVGYPGKP